MHQIHTKHAKISEKVLHIPSNKIVVSFKKIHRSKNKEQTDLIPTAQDPQRDPTDLDTLVEKRPSIPVCKAHQPGLTKRD
jgi:hypothetical protein